MKAETTIKLHRFFKQFEVKKFRRGEVIIAPGELNKKIYYIDEGFAKIYYVNSAGVESGSYFFRSLFYLTMIQQMTGKRNSFYFEAITPAVIYVAPEEEVLKFLRENPEVKEDVQTDIMRCFLELLEYSTAIISIGAKSRVAWIVLSINERLERERLVNEQVGFEYTHQLIASLTGLTRETVTLQLLALKKAGLIENKHKNIKILNKEKLEKVALGMEN